MYYIYRYIYISVYRWMDDYISTYLDISLYIYIYSCVHFGVFFVQNYYHFLPQQCPFLEQQKQRYPLLIAFSAELGTENNDFPTDIGFVQLQLKWTSAMHRAGESEPRPHEWAHEWTHEWTHEPRPRERPRQHPRGLIFPVLSPSKTPHDSSHEMSLEGVHGSAHERLHSSGRVSPVLFCTCSVPRLNGHLMQYLYSADVVALLAGEVEKAV